jgi:hypothetical protein
LDGSGDRTTGESSCRDRRLRGRGIAVERLDARNCRRLLQRFPRRARPKDCEAPRVSRQAERATKGRQRLREEAHENALVLFEIAKKKVFTVHDSLFRRLAEHDLKQRESSKERP